MINISHLVRFPDAGRHNISPNTPNTSSYPTPRSVTPSSAPPPTAIFSPPAHSTGTHPTPFYNNNFQYTKSPTVIENVKHFTHVEWYPDDKYTA